MGEQPWVDRFYPANWKRGNTPLFRQCAQDYFPGTAGARIAAEQRQRIERLGSMWRDGRHNIVRQATNVRHGCEVRIEQFDSKRRKLRTEEFALAFSAIDVGS